MLWMNCPLRRAADLLRLRVRDQTVASPRLRETSNIALFPSWIAEVVHDAGGIPQARARADRLDCRLPRADSGNAGDGAHRSRRSAEAIACCSTRFPRIIRGDHARRGADHRAGTHDVAASGI